jgi:hypothetical protein
LFLKPVTGLLRKFLNVIFGGAGPALKKKSPSGFFEHQGALTLFANDIWMVHIKPLGILNFDVCLLH